MPLLDGWGLCEAIRKMDPQGAHGGSQQWTGGSVDTATAQGSGAGTGPDTCSGGGASASRGARTGPSGGAQSRTIVIGMSAAGTNNEMKAKQAGMDGFLVKPFRLAELMSIITARAHASCNDATGGGVSGQGAGTGTGTITGNGQGMASVIASAFASNAGSSNAGSVRDRAVAVTGAGQ